MKYCGVTREKGHADRIKWDCPKVHMVKGNYVCDCDNPCSTATIGRTAYACGSPLQNQNNCGTCHRASKNQHVCCREEIQKSHHHKGRGFSCRSYKPAYCHWRPQYELSTIHPKLETFNCLKEYSIVIEHLWAY